MKNLKVATVLGLACAALAVACGSSAPPAPRAAPKPKAAPPALAAAQSADAGVGSGAESQAYVYAYNPVAKRDPFRVLFEQIPGRAAGDSAPTCSEPLCQYDLDQLTLVAVVSGDANPVAMLEDRGRVGHIVRRNSKVGKQGGKVTQILRDCIVVTEYFTSPDGKVNPNRVNLCVKQDKAHLQVLDLFNNKNIEPE